MIRYKPPAIERLPIEAQLCLWLAQAFWSIGDHFTVRFCREQIAAARLVG